MTARKAVGSDQHGRPGLFQGSVTAHPAPHHVHQAALKRSRPVGRELSIRRVSKAGGDAIDGFTFGYELVLQLNRPSHSVHHLCRQVHRRSPSGHRDDRAKREGVACDLYVTCRCGSGGSNACIAHRAAFARRAAASPMAVRARAGAPWDLRFDPSFIPAASNFAMRHFLVSFSDYLQGGPGSFEQPPLHRDVPTAWQVSWSSSF